MAARHVSVIIPVKDGQATIARAIDSALGQCYGPLEVIVVNDGSTDSTANILARYGDRIRVITQENKGLAGARNAGVAISEGEYLGFLDADDEWLPEKLARTVTALENQPGSVLCYSDAIPVDEGGLPLGKFYVPVRQARAPLLGDLLTKWWPILPSTVVMRRGTFDRCGGFFQEYKRAYEDLEMWLMARELGSFEYVAQPLVRYRLTPVGVRMAKYETDYAIFERRVTERYGVTARQLIEATRKAYASSLGHAGLQALRRGERREARRYFMRALRYDPPRMRTFSRLARTFLPTFAARALTGRTRYSEPS